MNETEGIERYVLAQESWALALQGVLVLIVGFLILLWPVMTMDVLVIFIGAFALVSGIFALVAMTKAEKGRRGILILQGVVGIIFGIMLFAWPIASAAMLLWFIMAWLLVSGICKIVAAVQLPSGDASKWLLGLDGFFFDDHRNHADQSPGNRRAVCHVLANRILRDFCRHCAY